MKYICPRCGGPVQRGGSSVAAAAGGLVGALIAGAFGNFQCKQCGPIPRSEFPPEVRARMRNGSIIMIVIAIALLVGVIFLITAIQH